MMIIRGFIINTILNVEMSSIGETLLGTTLCKHDDLFVCIASSHPHICPNKTVMNKPRFY